jgi:hypothetical protein
MKVNGKDYPIYIYSMEITNVPKKKMVMVNWLVVEPTPLKNMS